MAHPFHKIWPYIFKRTRDCIEQAAAPRQQTGEHRRRCRGPSKLLLMYILAYTNTRNHVKREVEFPENALEPTLLMIYTSVLPPLPPSFLQFCLFYCVLCYYVFNSHLFDVVHCAIMYGRQTVRLRYI